TDTTLLSFPTRRSSDLNRIVNALTSTDKGLEFMMGFNRLPVSNLSLDLSGSYVETTNNSGTDKYFKTTDLTQDEIYGLYRPFTRSEEHTSELQSREKLV